VPLRAVIIGGIVALVVGIVIVLSQSGHELTGTNGAKRDQFVAVLHGGRQVCSGPATVPAGTGRYALEIGTYGRPGPPLRVAVGRAAGVLNPGWREGEVVVPLQRALAHPVTGRVCIRTGGARGSRIAIAGSQGTPSVYFERAHATSWWSRIGDLPRRLSFLGSWSFWLALALSVGAAALAVAVLWRVSREPGP
jgi:hypothetical protein